MPIKFTNDIERIIVQSEGKRTSVSLDGILCSLLQVKLGSEDAFHNWVKARAFELGESAELRSLRLNSEITISLSRLIQQQAIIYLAGEIVDPNPFSNMIASSTAVKEVQL